MNTAHRLTLAIAGLLTLSCQDGSIVIGPDFLDDSGSNALHGILQELILSQPCDLWVDDTGFEGLDLYVNALTGGPTFENEVHDCQRLVKNGEFGPMVGVMPLDSAMTAAAMDVLNDGPAVIASVFNWSYKEGDSYQPLGIGNEDPWSCLWVDLPNGEAGILEAPDDGSGCRFDADEDPNVSLRLHLATSPDLDPATDSVPKTARWRWDGESHYIGIRCGTVWCTISERELPALSVIETFPTLDGPKTIHVGRIDDQLLAVGKEGSLKPGPRGRIIPAERILGGTEFIDGAYLVVDATDGDATYVGKLGLEPVDSFFMGRIRLRVSSSGGDFKYSEGEPVRLRFLSNENHGAPESVRWRWREYDEDWWVPCIQGCCTPMF